MNLDYSKPGEVKIERIDYVRKMIEEFPYSKGMGATKIQTPVAKNSFQTRDCTNVSKEKAEAFHTWVAKGLFLCQRARLDIQTAIAFLCTRVKSPDEDDWKKLIAMLSKIY